MICVFLSVEKIPSGWLHRHLSPVAVTQEYPRKQYLIDMLLHKVRRGKNSKEHCHDDVNGNKR